MAGAKRGCLAVLAVLLLGGLVLAAVGAWFWHDQSRFADAPITPDQSSVVIASGDGLNTVLGKLRAAGVDEGNDTQWTLLARQLDAAGKLKVGEYALDAGLTPRELLIRMRQGRVLQHRLTIVEGWNIRQVRAALKRADPLRHTTDDMD
ncbi:endolytic transglycosylase MltG, partial [Stenotrophomonas sp.]